MFSSSGQGLFLVLKRRPLPQMVGLVTARILILQMKMVRQTDIEPETDSMGKEIKTRILIPYLKAEEIMKVGMFPKLFS
jgi:hypothetical protein